MKDKETGLTDEQLMDCRFWQALKSFAAKIMAGRKVVNQCGTKTFKCSFEADTIQELVKMAKDWIKTYESL